MTDHLNHGHSGHGVEFEPQDLSSRGVFGFFVGLAITGVVIYFIITAMYGFLDKYEQSQMSSSSPLTKPEDSAMIGARRLPNDYAENRFKDNGAPLLEVDERNQLQKFVLDQEKQLHSYGWVDQKAGVAHIPIDRAMELLAERGLPVRSETADGRAPVTDKPLPTMAAPKAATAKKK